MNIGLIRKRILAALLIVVMVAVLVAIPFYCACALNIARPRIMIFVWVFIFIGIPTVVSLALTYLLLSKIHAGFLFRWFATSACALVMVSSVYIPLSFLSDDADDRASTTTEDFVSNWICFPIISPTYMMENDNDSSGPTVAMSLFLLPAILWGLIFERLLNAMPLRRLILLFTIIAWAIWLGATPVKAMAETAISVAVTCKWAVSAALTLIMAGPVNIWNMFTRHSDQGNLT